MLFSGGTETKFIKHSVCYNDTLRRNRGMDSNVQKTILWFVIVVFAVASGETAVCPTPETILPCICTHRNEDIQIWY